MLAKLRKFFETELNTAQVTDSPHQLNKSCAALMLEVARADLEVDQTELERIAKILRSDFNLTDVEVKELMELVQTDDHSIHPFTSLINEHYDEAQKIKLMQNLWSVAFADGELSMYEDASIRKIADLLYIRHKDFIQTKHSQSN